MSGRGFDVSVEQSPDVAIVRCAGELDIGSATDLAAALDDCIGSSPRRVKLDCDGITFVDSSGIRTIVIAARRCHETGIELEIDPSEQLQKIAEVLGVAPALGLSSRNGSAAPLFPDLP